MAGGPGHSIRLACSAAPDKTLRNELAAANVFSAAIPSRGYAATNFEVSQLRMGDRPAENLIGEHGRQLLHLPHGSPFLRKRPGALYRILGL